MPPRLNSPNFPVPVTFAECYAVWLRARRGKKPSANQLAFAGRWLDSLQTLHADLRAGAWQPRRTVSFVVKHPKTREIHAPVDRLQRFMRQRVGGAGKLARHSGLRRNPAEPASWAPAFAGVTSPSTISPSSPADTVQMGHGRAPALGIRATAAELEALRAQLSSCWGHFRHAHSVRLRHALFDLDWSGDIAPRWVLQGETFDRQCAWLPGKWPVARCQVQKATAIPCLPRPASAPPPRVHTPFQRLSTDQEFS